MGGKIFVEEDVVFVMGRCDVRLFIHLLIFIYRFHRIILVLSNKNERTFLNNFENCTKILQNFQPSLKIYFIYKKKVEQNGRYDSMEG